jgi:hypothetical protein
VVTLDAVLDAAAPAAAATTALDLGCVMMARIHVWPLPQGGVAANFWCRHGDSAIARHRAPSAPALPLAVVVEELRALHHQVYRCRHALAARPYERRPERLGAREEEEEAY